MNHGKSILATAFMALLFFNIVTAVVPEPAANVTSPGGIETSSGGDRETWWHPNWHQRMFINVSCDENAPMKKGRVVEHVSDLVNVEGLDLNSIRLVKDGAELPCDYDAATGTITFVIDKTIGAGQTVQYAVYYDLIENGLKPVPDYDPSWVQASYDIASGDTSQYEAEAEAELDAYMVENNIGNASGVYYYGDHLVYEENGAYYYEENNTIVNANLTVDDLNDVYILTDIDGNEFMVYQNATTGIWYYVNGTEYDGEVDAASRVYRFKDDLVFFDETSGTWNYTSGGVLTTYVLYDPAAVFTWDALTPADPLDDITLTGLFIVCNATAFPLAYYSNVTSQLFVYDSRMYDGAGGYREGHPYDITGQTVYDGAELYRNSLDALTVTESFGWESYDVENVKAKASGSGTFYNASNPGQSFTQWVQTRAYRGSNDIIVNFQSDAAGLKVNPAGKIFVNLGGAITIDGSPVIIDDLDDWIENQASNLGMDVNLTAFYEEYRDNPGELVNDASRIAVLLSDGASFNIDDIDFDLDGIDMLATAHDLVQKFLLQGAIGIKVVPKIVTSEFVALYDLVSQQGVGIKISGASDMINLLVEAWEVITPEQIYNYVTIGFNYLGWDWDMVGDAIKTAEEYAGFLDENFDAVIAYLDTIIPYQYLDSLLTTLETTDPSLLYAEGAIPIDIILHSPVPGQAVDQASDLLINVTVAGETLAYAQHYIDVDGVLMDFETWNEIVIGNGNEMHKGKRMSVVRKMETIGQATIHIIAYDTNGEAILASAAIIVDGKIVDEVTWTITIGSIGTILALLGLAGVQNKKTRAGCVGGACNIS